MIPYDPVIKRLLDILGSLAALALFSPLLAFFMALIRIESKGSPLFLQERVGRNMRPFRLCKLRTMTVPPPQKRSQFDPGDACRVTRMGALLRKTKIDELPELFNVFKGDMSIVGPRPEVPKYVAIYKEEFNKILKTRPGLSDFASIKYSHEEGILSARKDPERYYIDVILPDKLRLARKYVDSITFKTDVKVVLETVRKLLA